MADAADYELEALIAALRDFHTAAKQHGPDGGELLAALSEQLADQYTLYDDVMFTTYHVECPLDTYDGYDEDDDDLDEYDDDFDDEYDDEDEDDEDDDDLDDDDFDEYDDDFDDEYDDEDDEEDD
ncbi:hypothetical protein [Trueperella sp. LYQ143]|uniref:hypothetical protein n=1 Tax=unclassified Trueperella TaxID=2630174 RepID=UPI003983D1AB